MYFITTENLVNPLTGDTIIGQGSILTTDELSKICTDNGILYPSVQPYVPSKHHIEIPTPEHVHFVLNHIVKGGGS